MAYIDPNDRPAPSFDPLGPPPKKSRGGGGFVIAAALVVIFGIGVWYAYSQGVQRGGSLVPPLIKADSSPVKQAPDNPGGLQVPNQDKQIFESMASAPRPQQAERLLPPPEQPKPEATRPPAPATPPDVAPAAGGPALPAVPQTQVTAAPVPPQAPPPQAVAEVVKPAQTVPALPTQQTAAPADPKPAPQTAALPSRPAAPAPVSGGAFRIQLGSLGDQAAADAEWKRLAKTHADILGEMPHAIERVDLAKVGTRYRIQAGAFADRAAAAAACDRIRAKAPTQGCIVAAR